MTDATRLAGLVASRICHDLISPVGAVGNGLELMRAAPGDEEALALVEESAAAATDSLKFLRLAFGARDPAERVGRAELSAASSGWFVRRKFGLDWRNAPDDAPMRLAQPLLLLAIAAASTAPRGGRLSVERATAEPLAAIWRIEADPLRPSPRLLELLAGDGTEAATPAEAHLLLLRRAAEASGTQLFWDDSGMIGLA